MPTKQKKIDINEATKEDLMKIPGVGDVTADAIIEFRDSRGRIDDISELEEAEQINSQDIESLSEWITVGSLGSEEFEGEEAEDE